MIPRVAEGAGLRAEITGLELPNIPRATRVVVALDTGAAAPALVDARLSVEGAAPCASGARARTGVVDGRARWERPVGLAGATPPRLRLGHTTPDPPGDVSYVDLLVNPGGAQGWRCLRLPLTGEDPRLGWRSSGTWALG